MKNESIFPKPINNNNQFVHVQGGLTKREIFAAMAMQAHLTGATVYNGKELAKMSVKNADTLIKELEK